MAGDVTASAMLASTETPVVGFVMLSLFNSGTYPTLAAIGTVISLVTSAIVLDRAVRQPAPDRRAPDIGAAC